MRPAAASLSKMKLSSNQPRTDDRLVFGRLASQLRQDGLHQGVENEVVRDLADIGLSPSQPFAGFLHRDLSGQGLDPLDLAPGQRLVAIGETGVADRQRAERYGLPGVEQVDGPG